jgi:hypothetical protein
MPVNDFIGGLGAIAFGFVVGWYAYSVSRNRQDAVALADIGVLIGAVAGAGILALFPAGSLLFAWYGIGLALGFFTYFFVLLRLVRKNAGSGWTTAYFLDGRRPPLPGGHDRAAVPAMGDHPPVAPPAPGRPAPPPQAPPAPRPSDPSPTGPGATVAESHG